MKDCNSCKNDIEDGASFCPTCGASQAPKAASPYNPPRSQLGTPAHVDPQETPTIVIIGFVLSFIPLLCLNFVGGILGIVGLNKIASNPARYKGRGLAIASIVLGFGVTGVGMLGVLAMIAIPNFVKFQTHAKRSEATLELKQLHGCQAAYYAEHRKYALTFAQLDCDFEPQETDIYTLFLGNDTMGTRVLPQDLSVTPAASETAYRALAIGNIDSDATLDVWVIDSQSTLENIADDVDT